MGLFVLCGTACTAQVLIESDTNPSVSTDSTPFHYPYYGKRVPPFLGILGGYEGFANQCWEAGIIVHYADFTGNHAFGPITGFALTYKQSLAGRLRTIEGEIGVYTPFSIGIGFNRNYYEGTRTFGFRPFIGTSWYHFQFLAGYNFYSERQTTIGDLEHFTVKIRYALPVVRLLKSSIPNPQEKNKKSS